MTKQTLIAALTVAVGTAAAHAQNLVFVDDDGPNGGDGTSWAQAFNNLDDAIAAARSGDTIWVAEGTYTPRTNGDSTSTFNIDKSLLIYGGFEGTEKFLEDRPEFGDFRSFLDGDIASGSADDIERLITVDNVGNLLIDGFFVVNAYDDDSTPVEGGAGIRMVDSDVLLRNVIFENCVSENGFGGAIGIFGTNSFVQIEDATFSDNSSGAGGGAIYSEIPIGVISNARFVDNFCIGNGGAILLVGDGFTSITDSTFIRNEARGGSGGAVSSRIGGGPSSSGTLFDNCEFIRNEAFTDPSSSDPNHGGALEFRFTGWNIVQRSRFHRNLGEEAGGAIYTDLGSGSLDVENSFLSGNITSFQGGGIYQRGQGTLRVINSTIIGNNGTQIGAGIFTANGDCFVSNTILWDNENSSSPGQPRQDQFSFNGGPTRTISLDYSIVRGWAASPLGGTATTGADPQFLNPRGNDNVYGSADDDPRVTAGSPAIDVGNSLAVTPEGSISDLFGGSRYADDIGTADGGVAGGSSLPIVDIGAVEFQSFTLFCPGDANGDGAVTALDISLVLSNFGNPLAIGPIDGDVTGDNVVTALDISEVLSNFGTVCP